MKILDFLKSNITPDITLLSIVEVFSRMCRINIECEDEMFLFEADTHFRDNKNIFIFSLVRQYTNGGDEPIQIHCDIIYNFTEDMKKLSECSWHESAADLIQNVLFSKAFEICKNNRITEIDVWKEEC